MTSQLNPCIDEHAIAGTLVELRIPNHFSGIGTWHGIRLGKPEVKKPESVKKRRESWHGRQVGRKVGVENMEGFPAQTGWWLLTRY